jgi:hypothetical protein
MAEIVIERSPILLGCEEFDQHLGLINRLLGQGVVDYDSVSVAVRDVKSMYNTYTQLPQYMIIEEVQDFVDRVDRRERTRLYGTRRSFQCYSSSTSPCASATSASTTRRSLKAWRGCGSSSRNASSRSEATCFINGSASP